jgi:hypothetical protein
MTLPGQGSRGCSVAIVVASTHPGTFGNGLVRRVLEGGFPGPLHPVNPLYEEVEGLRCVPALAELPHPADLTSPSAHPNHPAGGQSPGVAIKLTINRCPPATSWQPPVCLG